MLRRSSPNELALAQDPGAWKMQGRSLLDAANVLWDTTVASAWRTGGDPKGRLMTFQYSLLVGFAFENLIKGLLVEKEPAKYALKTNWETGSGHELAELARLAEINPTAEELSLLDFLEQTILWSGRYPTKKNHGGKRFVLVGVFPEVFSTMDPTRAAIFYSELVDIFSLRVIAGYGQFARKRRP